MRQHTRTPWTLYTNMITSFVGEGFCWTLRFFGELDDTIQRTVIYVPWLYNLTCPLHEYILQDWLVHVPQHIHYCTLFKWGNTHFAAILHCLSPVLKFSALLLEKSLYTWLIPAQSRACLSFCIVQLWSLTCLCERTQDIHCDACWQFTPFHQWMPVPS